jgi:hypothetical protein
VSRVAVANDAEAIQDSKGAGFGGSADEIMTIQDWITQGLRDPAAQWSAGTYGAIAEFSRDPVEPADVVCAQFGGAASTARGGIRVELCKEMRAVTYETTAKNRDQWGHAIALCLAAEDCAMGRRTTVHELGPDSAAIRRENRDSILFDLGLGARVFDGVAAGDRPEALIVPQSRFARGVIRVALRQLKALNGSSPSLSQWRQAYDLAEPGRGHGRC